MDPVRCAKKEAGEEIAGLGLVCLGQGQGD
jgi:hypothetical protein